jgi:Tfp pilus assembly protein PilF
VIGVLVTARHRLPVIPILLVFAVYGGFELYRRLRAGPVRARILWGGLAALLMLLTNTEWFGIGYENRRQSHVNLALAYERLDDTEQMVRHLDSALVLDSNSVLALNNRAVAFMAAGDLYMARRLLSRALALAPNDPEVTNNLATVMVRQGVNEEALVMFQQVARQRPDWAEPMYSIATIWAGRDQPDSALRYYDLALARDPYFVQALNDKGSLYQKRGNHARARIEWRRAFEIKPDYALAGLNLVRSFLEAGERDSAKAVLRRSKEPWRGSPEWYFNYALAALAGADRAHALELLEEMQQRYPGHALTTSLARKLGDR